MAISQLSPTRKSPRGSPPKSNGDKALEVKKTLVKPSIVQTKKKKVTFNVPQDTTSVKANQAPPVNKCMNLVKANNFSAMKRAEEVQANLPPKYPTCIKPMLLSHVTGGFWLSLPRSFCKIHMPQEDEHKVVLVNENGEEYETKYLARKNGLSGGWRGFSIAHNLVEGDVLVFQLIEPCKFKVYILRANALTEIDGAIGLLTLDSGSQSCKTNGDQVENAMEICEDEDDGYFDNPIPLNSCEYGIDGKDTVAFDIEPGTSKGQTGNETDDASSEFSEGLRFSDSTPDFESVKNINSFRIHVDGLVIDSEMPPHLRIKYYDLCCSQSMFLHNNLLTGLNLNLVSGIISETVNIADAIRASKFTTAKENLMIWDQTLEGFEKLGMNVAFLRARISRLVNLAFKTRTVLENKKIERAKAEEEMRVLEAKFLDLKQGMKVLDSEIEGLMNENETIEGMFKTEANAPW